MKLEGAIIATILLASGCRTPEIAPAAASAYFGADFTHLTFSSPRSIEDIERQSLAELAVCDRPDIPMVPFGFENAAWQRLKGRMEPGDRIVFFDTPELWWKQERGYQGFALLRGDLLIDLIITKVN